jgi:magnesium-transporting ATPase (P-type)
MSILTAVYQPTVINLTYLGKLSFSSHSHFFFYFFSLPSLSQTNFVFSRQNFFLCFPAKIFFSLFSRQNFFLLLSADTTDPGLSFVVSFFTYLILFSFFIPQSMMVTLEIVKVVQAKLMDWDRELRANPQDPETGMNAKTSNLNDELGLVKKFLFFFIFLCVNFFY